MLEQRLREIIPNPNSTFRELEKEEICSFDRWDTDKKNRVCLYYVVGNKNKKRVVISEIEELIRNCLTRGQINRKDFEVYCHTSNSDGACGFAVMGRMLEYLGIAQYLGWGRGFEIIDVDLARSLIRQNNDAPEQNNLEIHFERDWS